MRGGSRLAACGREAVEDLRVTVGRAAARHGQPEKLVNEMLPDGFRFGIGQAVGFARLFEPSVLELDRQSVV